MNDEIRFFRIRTRELKSLTINENNVLGVFIPAGTTGADLTQKWVDPNPEIRKWAQNMRNSRHISVPGELIPVVNDGEVAVPDFNMSGTRWFVIPERELQDNFDVEVHSYTPTEVVKAAPELVWSC